MRRAIAILVMLLATPLALGAASDQRADSVSLTADFLGEDWAVERKVFDPREPATIEAVYGWEKAREYENDPQARARLDAMIQQSLDRLSDNPLGIVALAYYTFSSQEQGVQAVLRQFSSTEAAERWWRMSFLPPFEGVDFTKVANLGDAAAFRPSPPRFYQRLGTIIIETRQTADRGHLLERSPPAELVVDDAYTPPSDYVRVGVTMAELLGGGASDAGRVWRQQPLTPADHRDRERAIEAAMQGRAAPEQ